MQDFYPKKAPGGVSEGTPGTIPKEIFRGISAKIAGGIPKRQFGVIQEIVFVLGVPPEIVPGI